jgi:hypothetical protein
MVIKQIQLGAICFTQFAGDIQAQARSAPLGGEEGFEYLPPVFRRNSSAIVNDMQFDGLCGISGWNL